MWLETHWVILSLSSNTKKQFKNTQTLSKYIKKLNNEVKPTSSSIKHFNVDLIEAFNKIQSYVKETNFNKTNQSIKKLNQSLKETTKNLGGIYNQSKMVTFVGMASMASVGAMGAGIANFGKGYINNQHKAKATGIKNFGGRSLQAVQNMGESITGNKDDLYNIIAHIQDNKTSIDTSTDLAKLGINQNDWVNMDWQTQLQTLLDKSKDSMFDNLYNDVFHEAIQNLSGGLNVNQLRALSSELPDVSKAFNEALQNVASSQNINKITQLGKEWQIAQQQFEAFFVDSASGVNKEL